MGKGFESVIPQKRHSNDVYRPMKKTCHSLGQISMSKDQPRK